MPCGTVSVHDSIDHCMQLMTDRRMRHLPVVDNGQLVGMISVGDAVKAQLSDQENVICGLESYIHGPVGERSRVGRMTAVIPALARKRTAHFDTPKGRARPVFSSTVQAV